MLKAGCIPPYVSAMPRGVVDESAKSNMASSVNHRRLSINTLVFVDIILCSGI